MPFVSFDPSLKVGHPKIDDQHSRLFDLVNNLHEAMRTGTARHQLAEVVAELRAYTVEHFTAEEGFMKSTAYPAFIEHKKLHDDLISQVIEIEKKLAAGSMTLSIQVMNILKDWLTKHISKEDKKLAIYLSSK